MLSGTHPRTRGREEVRLLKIILVKRGRDRFMVHVRATRDGEPRAMKPVEVDAAGVEEALGARIRHMRREGAGS